METAKIFENGISEESLWQTFIEGVEGFTSDIFEDGREQGVQEEREPL